ncbi:hypothetical protein QF034_006624 [Streptomyces africanus]|uniref:cytochrome-c oxidase n=1 Tax=Streptomyces africanus TaxID=231024 RepID=A0ABU0QYB7_9ACTN|nr:hypothetical protein [Streptomyces africanus]
MKSEAYLFAGVAAFFLVTDAAYIWFAREPAGIAALTVSFGMAAVIAFFCTVNYRRKGERPEDRPDSEIRERSGPLDFFPPHSGYPPGDRLRSRPAGRRRRLRTVAVPHRVRCHDGRSTRHGLPVRRA